jgi:hypothetical protein
LTPQRRQLAAIGIIVAGATFALLQSWEYIFPLGRGWIYDYGGGLETVPVHLALAQRQALDSLWTTFVAGGVDRLSFFGNADSPWLLSTWLFAILSPATASGLQMLLQIGLGAIFTGLYCRNKLQTTPVLSMFCATLYAVFSYPVFGHLFNSTVIPFLAYVMTWPRGRNWQVLLACGLTTSLLTSLSQGFPFIVLFMALWSVLVERIVVRQAALLTISFSAGYLVLKLPTLLAILANAPASQRSGEFRYDSLIDTSVLYTESDFLYSDVHMWTFTQITSGFFLALGGALLVMGLVDRSGRQDDGSRTLAGSLVGMLIVYILLASGIALPIRNVLAPVLPWLGSFNMVRTITTAGAFLNSMAATAGIALLSHDLGRGHHRRCLLAILSALAFTATISPAHIARDEMLALVGLFCGACALGWLASRPAANSRDDAGSASISRINLAITAPCMIAVLAYGILWPKASLWVFRQSADTGYNLYHMPAIAGIESNDHSPHRYASVLPLQPAYALSNGIETIDGWANLYSSQFRRFWLAILDPLFTARPQERAIFGADGGRPQDHYIFLGTGAIIPGDAPGIMNVDLRFNMTLLSLMNTGYLLSYYPLQSRYLQPVHTPGNPHAQGEQWGPANGRATKLSAANNELNFWKALPSGMNAFFEHRPAPPDRVYAYRNVCALPRVFAVDSLQHHDDDATVLQSLATASPVELLHNAHMVGELVSGLSKQLSTPAIRIQTMRSDQLSFTANSDGDAFIVVGNTWSAGWKAYVDDVEMAPVRVNYIQIGIPLRAGSHRVRLAYAPSYGWASRLVALPLSFQHQEPQSDWDFKSETLPAVCGSPSPPPPNP